jgi:hypothetical protein
MKIPKRNFVAKFMNKFHKPKVERSGKVYKRRQKGSYKNYENEDI